MKPILLAVLASAARGAVVTPPNPSPVTRNAAAWYTVALENGVFTFPQPTLTRFGAPGSYTVPATRSGSVTANTATFGDPAGGRTKEMQTNSAAYATLNKKIMCVGDSITGYFVGELRTQILADPAPFTNISFVGSENGSPTHTGSVGGLAASALAVAGNTYLPTWFNEQSPDIVLIQMGTNDRSGVTQDTLNGYSAILAAARATHSAVRVFIAQITPGDASPQVPTINAAIPGWAASNTTTASPIAVVDMYTGFSTATMTIDGTHPNLAGQQFIASRWLTAIRPSLSNAPVTTVLLSLTTASGSTADLGSTITAQLATGVTGTFQFTKNTNPISGATGTANSLGYTVQAADQDQILNVNATNLTFTAGLTSAVDSVATLSFYGSMSAAGSTLTAVLSSGFTGTITIKRANGTTAATGTAVSLASYVLSAGDLSLGPFTATASNLVLTLPIGLTAGAAVANPLATVSANLFGATVAADDSFNVILQAGVSGVINFAANGVAVTTRPGVNNAGNYVALAADAGTSISTIITNLTFRTAGVFATPVIQSAVSAPFMYGIDVRADRYGLRVAYMPLNVLDTGFVPAIGNYAIGGTLLDAKTISGVAIDNTDPDYKSVVVSFATPFHRGEVPTLSYTGTAVRYPGGASAATFTGLGVANFLGPLPDSAFPMQGDPANQTLAAGTILMLAGFTETSRLVYVRGDTNNAFVTDFEAAVEMSILPDWGTDTGFYRQVSFTTQPGSYNGPLYQHFSCRRVGNTVQMYAKPESTYFTFNFVDAVLIGPSFTFASPGPLCKARLIRKDTDFVPTMQTSEDGGDTWTSRATAPAIAGQLAATVFSNSATIPITDVATFGFKK